MVSPFFCRGSIIEGGKNVKENRKKAGYLARVIGIVLLASVGFSLGAPVQAAPKGAKLVWSEEFNQTLGSGPDPSKWSFTFRRDNQDEMQTYTRLPKNVSIVADPNAGDGKALRIQVLKEADGTFTSARITTQDKAEFKYGCIECRAKLPGGQGMWPAFWMLGMDINKVSWPQCGEVDIMEAIGKEPAVNHGSVHGPGYTGEKLGSSYVLPGGKFFKDDYHVFAMEWTAKHIRFFVDGNAYKTFLPSDVPAGKWVFDHPFYLILQLALGGGWSGPPDATTVFPQSLLVDYVRVYQFR